MKIKTKIKKWDLIKFKSLCTAKETMNKTKRKPSKWEKIFTIEETEKGLIYKIYKQLMQLYIKKKKNKTTQSKNEQKISIDISPKKTYRLPRGI